MQNSNVAPLQEQSTRSDVGWFQFPITLLSIKKHDLLFKLEECLQLKAVKNFPRMDVLDFLAQN